MRRQACERLLKLSSRQAFSVRQLGNLSGLAREDLPAQTGAPHLFRTSPGSATSSLLPLVPQPKDLRSACALPHARAPGGDGDVQAHIHNIADHLQHFRMWGALSASSRGHAEPLLPSSCSHQPHVGTAMYPGHTSHSGNDIVTNWSVQPRMGNIPCGYMSRGETPWGRSVMVLPSPPSAEGGAQEVGGQVSQDLGMLWEGLGRRGGLSTSLWEDNRSVPLHRQSLWQEGGSTEPLHRDSVRQEEGKAEPLYADSVRRKRKHKMNKHKHRKRRKKLRHQK